MVMSSRYTCSSCGIEFIGSDASDLPILCDRCVLKEFAKKLEENSKDMPPEFIDMVDKRFWELV